MLAFVLVFGTLLLLVASLLGPKGKGFASKFETYECGLVSEKKEETRVPVKFYLTGILFILFDIEIIFMYPWALVYMDFIREGKGVYIFSIMAFFLLIFIFGLFWEFKSKALDWGKNKNT